MLEFLFQEQANKKHSQVLRVAAFVCCEYSESLPDNLESFDRLASTLGACQDLDWEVQTVNMHNVLKLVPSYSHISHVNQDDVVAFARRVQTSVRWALSSTQPLVKEGAKCTLLLLGRVVEAPDVFSHCRALKDRLFSDPIKPLGKGAQGKVPIPPGLDLNQFLEEDSPTSMSQLDVSFFGPSTQDAMEVDAMFVPSQLAAQDKDSLDEKQNKFYLPVKSPAKMQSPFYLNKRKSNPRVPGGEHVSRSSGARSGTVLRSGGMKRSGAKQRAQVVEEVSPEGGLFSVVHSHANVSLSDIDLRSGFNQGIEEEQTKETQNTEEQATVDQSSGTRDDQVKGKVKKKRSSKKKSKRKQEGNLLGL